MSREVQVVSTANIGKEDHLKLGESAKALPKVYWVLDDMMGDILRPDKKAFIRKCRPHHAWALTIHKFQVQ